MNPQLMAIAKNISRVNTDLIMMGFTSELILSDYLDLASVVRVLEAETCKIKTILRSETARNLLDANR